MVPCLIVIPLVIALCVAISAGLGWIFWTLWSYVAVPVFHAPALTFYQAWALWLLIAMVGNTFRSFNSKSKD